MCRAWVDWIAQLWNFGAQIRSSFWISFEQWFRSTTACCPRGCMRLSLVTTGTSPNITLKGNYHYYWLGNFTCLSCYFSLNIIVKELSAALEGTRAIPTKEKCGPSNTSSSSVRCAPKAPPRWRGYKSLSFVTRHMLGLHQVCNRQKVSLLYCCRRTAVCDIFCLHFFSNGSGWDGI